MPWHATQRYTDQHDYHPTSDTTTVRHPSDPNHHTTTSGKGPDQDLLRRTPLPNNSILVRLHLTSVRSDPRGVGEAKGNQCRTLQGTPL